MVSNEKIVNSNSASIGTDSNVPVLEDTIMDENFLSTLDDDWMNYFNAEMFEPYSPSNPFLIHSLLDDLAKHQKVLDGRDDGGDIVAANNISVMPQAFEELSLDANVKAMSDDQTANIDVFTPHFFNAYNNIDPNINTFANAPSDFGDVNGFHQGSMTTPFVGHHQKSCALQHLAAETADAASLLDVQHTARCDNHAVSPQGFLFDDTTLKLLAKYFGLDEQSDAQSSGMINVQRDTTQSHIDPMLLNPGHFASNTAESDVSMPLLKIQNEDLNNIEVMNGIAEDSSDEGETDDDDNTIEPANIVRHFWLPATNDIRFQVRHRATNIYLTAKQLEDRFEGVKIAIWTYWKEKAKKKGRIPYARVRAYLETFGVEGFYSEVLWQFCTPEQHKELRKRRKDGTLSNFVFK